MGAYNCLQLFSPPGVTTDAATPNFLRDLTTAVYQAQWTDMTQGGAATAQFDCRKDYSDIVDVVFGSYVLWGMYGAKLSANASVGDGHVTVTGLLNEQFLAGQTFQDLAVGDVVMLTDGANTELFSVGAISGSGPWTVTLNSPGTSLLGLGGTLLNAYSSGAILVRLMFQGYLTQRVHSTAFDNQFSINASGFFSRYAQLLENQAVQGKDGGTWLYTHLLSIAGGATLAQNYPSGTTVFQCSDLASLEAGEQISIGIEAGNSENFTIASINVSNGTFTTGAASTKSHAKGEVVSPRGIGQGISLPDMIVAQSLMPHPNNKNVNLNSTQQPLADCIAAVVRQETGASLTSTYACWVDVLRQVHHAAITSVPPRMAETKMTSDTPAGGSTFHVKSLSQIKVGRRVFITGAAGFDSLKVSAVHSAFNSFDTVGNSTFDHPAGDKVVAIYDVSPNFTISQGDNGSGYGDTINKIQTTDMDGTQLINAAIVTGTVISQNGQVQTTLASAVSVGATTIPLEAMPFVAGDTVQIVASGGVNTENVVIISISGNSFTCAPIQYAHDAGRPVVLVSGGGAGPQIIVFESDSIGSFGYFEGQISTSDIGDIPTLKTWAKQQIELTAWPLINAAIDLDVASCRIDGRTLLGITGFDDGVPLYLNVTQVQYQWLAATNNVTAAIQAGALKSTSGSVLKELANRHAIRDHQQNPKQRPHGFDGHIAGGELYQNADNTFSLAACTVKYGGAIFQLPAIASQAAPEGVSFWGVDLSTPATPAFNMLPSIVSNGRYLFGEYVYQATDDDGVDATLVSSFTGVPLWRVEVRGGVLQGARPMFATNGVKLSNLPSATAAPPAPTFSSSIPTTPGILASAISADLNLATVFTNIPQDEATNRIKYYIRTSGTTAWSHKFTRTIPGLPIPSAQSLTDSPVFQNMPGGVTIDVGASYAGTNGESAITVLISGYALPSPTTGGGGVATCTEGTQAVTTSATQLVAANSGRIGLTIFNRANNTLYVGTDNTTSPTKFMAAVGPGQSWVLPVAYTGAVWVVWAATDSAAGAQANYAAFPS